MQAARTYLMLSLSLLACASDKSDKPDAQTSDASDQSGSKSSATGGNSSAGQAGKTGSSTSANTGTAGRKATQNDEDAGPGAGGSGGKMSQAPAAGSGTSTATKLPEDGNQLALCSMAQGDCNKGFACHAPANAYSPGRGFCSKICEQDSDCGGVEPSSAKYTCSAGTGTRTCELACTGTDDSTSCPSELKCVQTAAAISGGRPGAMGMMGASGNGAGGANGSAGTGNGTPAQFRCRYPFETSPTWGACSDGAHVCDKDLSCIGGYCAQSCEMDGDCKDKPSSGSISPSCATLTPARGMTQAVKNCVLDCSAAKDGCPTGAMCFDGPRMGMGMNAKPEYARCVF